MSWKLAGAGVALVVLAFLAGRWTAPATPARVETKVETRYVDRVVTAEVVRTVRVAGPVRIRTRIVERPGGERVIEREVERAPVTTSTDSAAASSSSSSSSSSASTVAEAPPRPARRVDLEARWNLARPSARPEALGVGLSMRIGRAWLGLTDEAPTGELLDLERHRPGIRLGWEF